MSGKVRRAKHIARAILATCNAMSVGDGSSTDDDVHPQSSLAPIPDLPHYESEDQVTGSDSAGHGSDGLRIPLWDHEKTKERWGDRGNRSE